VKEIAAMVTMSVACQVRLNNTIFMRRGSFCRWQQPFNGWPQYTRRSQKITNTLCCYVWENVI